LAARAHVRARRREAQLRAAETRGHTGQRFAIQPTPGGSGTRFAGGRSGITG
jgi:hypothetical protein